MIYYLEDAETNVVLFFNADRYLITNIADGLLDVFIRMFPRTDLTVTSITKHLNQGNFEIGLRVDTGQAPVAVPLESYPHVVEKFKLIQLRKPAFEALMIQYQLATTKNTTGFGSLDFMAINFAVSNQKIIHEYAGIMKISDSFALDELSMINNSILSEQFRIYSLTNYWKEAINSATTKDEIDSIIERLGKSYAVQGGIDD